MSRILKLTLRFVPDFYYKRVQVYSSHVKYIEGVVSDLGKSQKVLLGASTFPEESAIWYLKGVEEDELSVILQKDPFVLGGLVESWEVEEMLEVGRGLLDGMASKYDYSCL